MLSNNKDLKATLFNQIARVLSGPIIFSIIPFYLNSVEQGYWFTFTSLSALMVFADLGFSSIVLQFSAHEFAFLEFNKHGLITGKEDNLFRLASFFEFSIKWFAKVSCFIFPLITLFGYFFLEGRDNTINWKLPWIAYSISSILFFFNSIILCFFEGCGSVSIIQKIRMKMCIIGAIITTLGLIINLKLFVLPLTSFISSIFSLTCIYLKYRRAFTQLFLLSNKVCINWYGHFLPLLLRYGVSWCSGYLTFQLFTPIAFKYFGADYAGKVGLSLSMWSVGMSISLSWITSITPKLNMLVAEKKWKELDSIFNKYIVNTMLTFLAGSVLYFLIALFFSHKIMLFNRILDFSSMLILAFASEMQLVVTCIATYLRAHKKEPMMLISIFSAIFVSIVTVLLAIYQPKEYYFFGYLINYLFVLPMTILLINKQKNMHL